MQGQPRPLPLAGIGGAIEASRSRLSFRPEQERARRQPGCWLIVPSASHNPSLNPSRSGPAVTTSASTRQEISTLYSLSAGDFVEVEVYRENGGALSV